MNFVALDVETANEDNRSTTEVIASRVVLLDRTGRIKPDPEPPIPKPDGEETPLPDFWDDDISVVPEMPN